MSDLAYNLEKYRAEDNGPGNLEDHVQQWQSIWDRFDKLLSEMRDLDKCASYALEDYIHDHITPELETAKDKLNDFLMGEAA